MFLSRFLVNFIFSWFHLPWVWNNWWGWFLLKKFSLETPNKRRRPGVRTRHAPRVSAARSRSTARTIWAPPQLNITAYYTKWYWLWMSFALVRFFFVHRVGVIHSTTQLLRYLSDTTSSYQPATCLDWRISCRMVWWLNGCVSSKLPHLSLNSISDRHCNNIRVIFPQILLLIQNKTVHRDTLLENIQLIASKKLIAPRNARHFK